VTKGGFLLENFFFGLLLFFIFVFDLKECCPFPASITHLFLFFAWTLAKSSDPRRVVILKLALEIQGRADVSIELDTAGTGFSFGYP